MTDGERIEMLEEKIRRLDAEISGLKLANDLLDMKIQALQPNWLGPNVVRDYELFQPVISDNKSTSCAGVWGSGLCHIAPLQQPKVG